MRRLETCTRGCGHIQPHHSSLAETLGRVYGMADALDGSVDSSECVRSGRAGNTEEVQLPDIESSIRIALTRGTLLRRTLGSIGPTIKDTTASHWWRTLVDIERAASSVVSALNREGNRDAMWPNAGERSGTVGVSREGSAIEGNLMRSRTGCRSHT